MDYLVLLTKLVLKAKRGEPPKALKDFCDNFYSPYYHFMYLASCQVDGYMVELGVNRGRGLVSLALSNNQVIGIDHTKSTKMEDLISMFGNIQFLHQSSLPAPDIFEPNSIGLLHIDTEHSESMAKAEFEAYQPYLKKPAIVIFDDLNAKDGEVGRYFESLPYSKIRDDDLHPSCGWGVLLYE